MTVKITGFADEIAPELTAQIAGLKGLGNVLCGDAWSGWRKSDLSHG